MLDGYQTIHCGAGARDGTLREKRLVLELTQQQVADKAKISLSSYQKFESGDRNIRTASFEVTCRVIKALEMDPTAFYEGEYIFGEPTIFDKEGHKYIRTGRLVNEDIDDREALNAIRIHIIGRTLFIPLKILRVLDSPELVNLMYKNDDRRFAIRIQKTKEDNSFLIPVEAYSGKWRGIRIENPEIIDIVYKLMNREENNYVCKPHFFEKGCLFDMKEIETSDYEIDSKKYYLIDMN